MPKTPASPLLDEALVSLDALKIEVGLAPIGGCWSIMIGGEPLTTGQLVARAIRLGMLGADAPVQ